MIMNQDDARRYEWLRSQFTSTGLRMDGTYLPILPVGRLPSANSLDASIDKAMGVTPTHEPLKPVFTVDEVVRLIYENMPREGMEFKGEFFDRMSTITDIKSALLKMKAGE